MEKKIENRKSVFPRMKGLLGRTPYRVYAILYFVYIIFNLIFNELFEGDRYKVLPFDLIGDFTGFFLACIMLGFTLVFIGHKYFNVKNSLPFIIVLSIMFVGNTVALSTFPETFIAVDFHGEDFFYNLLLSRRIQYIFSYLNACLFLYVTYIFVPHCRINKSYFKSYAYIFLAIVYLSIFYSFLANSEGYAFALGLSEIHTQDIPSFFGDKNVFGMVLFLGMIVHFKFLYEHGNKMHVFFILFLFLIQVLVACRSSMIASLALIIGYMIIIALKEMKRRKYISVIIFSIIGLGIILLPMILLIPAFSKIKIFKSLANAINGTFDKNSTFYSRILVWNKFFTLVNSNSLYFIFGLGSMNFNIAFTYAVDNNEAKYWHLHNGFLEPFGEGGIIRFIINLLFIIYIIYMSVRLFVKTKDKRILLYQTFFLSLCIRMIFEPEFLLSTNLLSILSIVIIALPLFTYKAQLNKEVTYRKPSLIFKQDRNYLRLLFLLPVIFIPLGVLSSKLLLQVAFIVSAVSLQFIAYFLLMRKKTYQIQEERKFKEFAFIVIMDCVIVFEAIICRYSFTVDIAHYLFSCFFAITFAFLFYYYSLEFSFIDDEIIFFKETELLYEKKYFEQMKRDEVKKDIEKEYVEVRKNE